MTMKTTMLVAALVAAMSAMSTTTAVAGGVPVMVGGSARFDACRSSGTVMGLNPKGDGFLSVRGGPGGAPYTEIDRVYNGYHVHICDQTGPWYAVVYTSSGAAGECGVTSPWPRRQAYTGP